MWKICAFHTEDAYYTEHATRLIESLNRWKLPYDIQKIGPYTDWFKGMQYKPFFLRDMLRKYPDQSIVYVDVDAIFCQYPNLFDKLDREMQEPIGVHVLDHSKYRRSHLAPEMLSGTIFLKNTKETCIIIQEWILELNKNPKLWDQCALAVVLKKHPFYILPEEYCTIFDYMTSVENPIIKHFQASRVPKSKDTTNMTNKSRLRVVENNSVIKLGRIHK